VFLVELPLGAFEALSPFRSDLALSERTLDSFCAARSEDLFAPVGPEGFLEHRPLTRHRLRLRLVYRSALNAALELRAQFDRSAQGAPLSRCAATDLGEALRARHALWDLGLPSGAGRLFASLPESFAYLPAPGRFSAPADAHPIHNACSA
jgi:hypothetical protein